MYQLHVHGGPMHESMALIQEIEMGVILGKGRSGYLTEDMAF